MTGKPSTPIRPGAVPGIGLAHGPEELRLFLRRLALLGIAIAMLLVGGTIGYALTEGTSIGFSLVWSLDTIATIGSPR